MSQMISSGSAAATFSNEVARLVREIGEQAIDHLVGLGADGVLDGGDLLRGEPLRHDRAQSEVARIVHVDHRAEELVHLLGLVADVGTLARAEEMRVAAHVPDVVVTGERPVAGTDREREVGDLALGEVDEAGCVAQRLERALAVRSRCCPEVGVGEVEVVEGDLVVGSAARHGGDCTRARAPRRCRATKVRAGTGPGEDRHAVDVGSELRTRGIRR